MSSDTPLDEREPGGNPLTGRHVLMALLGFFGVIITVNMIFLTFALRSFPGESMKKSYLQGLHYNEILTERAEQAALGWRAELLRADRNGAEGVIELQVFDAAGTPLSGLTVEGELRRPAHSRSDQTLSFMHVGNGVYRTPVSDLAPGAWSLTAQAENAYGDQLDLASRVEFP